MTLEQFIKISEIELSQKELANLGRYVSDFARSKRFRYEKIRDGKMIINDYPAAMFNSNDFIPHLVESLTEMENTVTKKRKRIYK